MTNDTSPRISFCDFIPPRTRLIAARSSLGFSNSELDSRAPYCPAVRIYALSRYAEKTRAVISAKEHRVYMCVRSGIRGKR